MPKFCICFKANSNDDRKYKQINKDSDVKSNRRKYVNFGLFLAGDDESGKTKMIEELVASHDSFTRKDKILKTSEIERYIRDSLTDILRAFEKNKPAVQLEYAGNEWRITYILTTANETNFEYPSEFFEHVEMLWDDAGLQTFLKKSCNYKFPDSAKYFLDRVSQIKDPDYIPTSKDMIHSRLFPSHIFKMSFEVEKERVRFNVLEMDLFREEQDESIQSFRHKSNAIIFITDCSCFDVIIDNKGRQTRLHQSLDLYKTIRNNKWLETTSCILLLNKQDLLAKKIKNGVRLEDYFPDFADYVLPDVHPRDVNSGEDPEVTRAKSFIKHQFLKVNHNCYRHFTCDSDICFHLIFYDCCTIQQRMILRNYNIHI